VRKKILPFNEDAPVKGYASHGYFSGILLDKELDGEVDAKFSNASITDSGNVSNVDWTSVDIGTDLNTGNTSIEEHSIAIKAPIPRTSRFSDISAEQDSFRFVYKQMENGAFIARLDYQTNSFVWAKAGIMLRDSIEPDSKFVMLLATPSVNGIRVHYRSEVGEDCKDISKRNVSFPVWFKIVRENETVRFYISNDEIVSTWELFSELQIKLNKSVYAGFAVTSSENEYWDWYMNNYIHLVCNKSLITETEISFDFYLGPRRDMNYQIYNPYIQSQCLTREMIQACFNSIHDLFVRAIEQTCYVHLSLDQYYVPDRVKYMQKHYCHENLIIGYDLNDRIYHLAGYNSERKFKRSTITFEELEQAYKNNYTNDPVYFHSVYHSPGIFRLDETKIIKSLNDYVNALDVSVYYADHKNPDPKRAFGVNVYEYLISQIHNYKKDFRPYYILWEHKKMMVLRIEYLYKKGLIECTCYADLLDMFQKIEEQANLLLMIHRKYIATKKDVILDSIIERLNGIKKLECQAIEQLINQLNKNVIVKSQAIV